ncbi:hypothetical protein [Bacteroides propionicifaciens]|uniref:hypothetical protein n=1 Tax=Bacteroides propionicifaciens TaxID=392838 RepID=UPI0006854298|nr:hypothetical protein [Bacteroides propionicifaciens]
MFRAIRAEMEYKWGQPEDAAQMTWRNQRGELFFVLPMIKYGNIVLTPNHREGGKIMELVSITTPLCRLHINI